MRRIMLLVFVAVSLVSIDALAADFSVAMTTDSMGVFRWSINGQLSPTLTLTRGQTYTFEIQAPGHPFDIKTAQVTGTADQFVTGVTGEGTTSGTLTFVVPTDPTTPPLFYQCEVHITMTGVIQLVAPPPVPAAGGLALGILALVLGAGGFALVRLRGAGAEPRLGTSCSRGRSRRSSA
jgi:hypothetical protein